MRSVSKHLLRIAAIIPDSGVLYNTSYAQLGTKYDSSVQSMTNIQYSKPKGDLFVGDCMPFFHSGTFYNYWLLDSAHHASLNGLGGHQWVLSTITDLSKTLMDHGKIKFKSIKISPLL